MRSPQFQSSSAVPLALDLCTRFAKVQQQQQQQKAADQIRRMTNQVYMLVIDSVESWSLDELLCALMSYQCQWTVGQTAAAAAAAGVGTTLRYLKDVFPRRDLRFRSPFVHPVTETDLESLNSWFWWDQLVLLGNSRQMVVTGNYGFGSLFDSLFFRLPREKLFELARVVDSSTFNNNKNKNPWLYVATPVHPRNPAQRQLRLARHSHYVVLAPRQPLPCPLPGKDSRGTLSLPSFLLFQAHPGSRGMLFLHNCPMCTNSQKLYLVR